MAHEGLDVPGGLVRQLVVEYLFALGQAAQRVGGVIAMWGVGRFAVPVEVELGDVPVRVVRMGVQPVGGHVTGICPLVVAHIAQAALVLGIGVGVLAVGVEDDLSDPDTVLGLSQLEHGPRDDLDCV